VRFVTPWFFSAKTRNSLAAVRGACVLSAYMGHCKGKDNVKKRAVRRKKTERLALAKSAASAAAK